jgi:hypothetical protein
MALCYVRCDSGSTLPQDNPSREYLGFSHIPSTQAPYALPYPLSRTDGPRHSRHDLGLNVLSCRSFKAQTPDLIVLHGIDWFGVLNPTAF